MSVPGVPDLPERGPCADHDPTWWFPTDYARDLGARLAKNVCASQCPALTRLSCLRFAMEHGEAHGIWGGLDPMERHALRAFDRRADPLAG